MNVYTDDCDHFIAESPEDLASVVAEYCGWKDGASVCSPEARPFDADVVLADTFGNLYSYDRVPDNEIIEVWFKDGQVADHFEGELLELTAAQWAKKMPRGFLCSTEG